MFKRALILFLIPAFMLSCGGGSNAPDPEITGLQPTSGPPGTTVTVSGSGFDPKPSGNEVNFNGALAPVVNASDSELQVTVPEEASSGTISVTVGDKTAIGPNFTVEALAPVISTVEPLSGPAGTEVTITGGNFSTNALSNTVTFNGVQASVQSATYNQLIVIVPENAGDGPVAVTVSGEMTAGPNFNFIPTISDKILFKSNPEVPNGDYDIYSINPDGTAQQKLFDNSGSVAFVSLSNDGTKVAFRLTENGDNELYVANTDGSNLQELTNLPDFIFYPSWSPDDSKIVFSNGTEDDAEIYIINVDGTGLTQITYDQAWNRYPQWSPDGSKILHGSNIDGDFEIYTMNPDGNIKQKLTDDGVDNTHARWSPDGSEIIFSSERDGIYGDIYRMNADGSNVRRVTTNNGGAGFPDWAPDGQKIVFKDNRELWILNADGSGTAEQITNNPNPNLNFIGIPDWSSSAN